MKRLSWLLVFLSIAVSLAYHVAIALRPSEMLPDRPFRDDSFYALTVSRNLAEGRGLTVSDGEIRTNGIQPLFVYVCAVPYLLTQDPYVALRLVQVLHLIVHAASTLIFFCFIRRFSRDRLTPWIGAAIWSCSFNILTQVMNGLETGFYLMMLQLCCWHYIRYGERGFGGVRDALVLGALLGLTTLTRIDAGLLAGAMALHYMIVNRRRGIGLVLKGPALWLAAWLPVTMPWWLYNIGITGSPLPTSGLVQTMYNPDSTLSVPLEILRNLWYAVQVLLDHALLIVFTPLRLMSSVTPVSVAVLLLKATLFVVLVRLAAKAWKPDGFPRSLGWGRTGFFPIFIAALLGFYVLVFTVEWYMNRYLIPASLASATLIPLMLERLHRRYAQVILALNILSTLAIGGYTYRLVTDTTYEDHWGWVRDHLADTTWVAAAQSGTLGYFHQRTINTDGKVNSEIYGIRLGGYGRYLDQRGILYFLEWDTDQMFYDSTFQALYEPIDRCGRTVVCRRRPVQ
jgi:hypothetical protein